MKILLVEDARSVVKVMTARLLSYGHEVVNAQNGLEAVTMFADMQADLILMDIEMPVMNGFVAVNKIREIEATQHWAWTPIIFLTSSDTVDNLITAIEAGGDDFMSKYVPESVLEAKMKAMSRIANLRQRLTQAHAQLQKIADHDGLTGLPNRRRLDQHADAAWRAAAQAGTPFAVLMLDLDNFKNYNDHYGHQAGDDCLKRVAQAIEATIQHSNARGLTVQAFAARYGGEEFAVLVPSAKQERCQQLAQAIVSAVSALGIAHEKNNAWGVTTVSIGGHWLQAAQGDLQQVFRQADAKLYQAKQQGRNRAQF
ncbi:diguanylate cyclase domain-containing protein [Rhodoferax sp.]|jgi:diguanylate cyclase (GGDEF)-like protein|uniref:GGDEF domain-containing response regulator n=1 Tax=Rhodoferax sp. TaxID=50421 RepID=UPI003784D787